MKKIINYKVLVRVTDEYDVTEMAVKIIMKLI